MSQSTVIYNRLRRVALVILVVGVVLFVAAVSGYKYIEGRDFYFKEINSLVKNAAGYTLHKDAPLSLSLWPNPTLTAFDLKIINPAVDSTQPIAEVRRVALALQWLPLLQLDLVLDVELEAPRIDLEIDADGRENWMNEELLTITGGLPFELDRIDTLKTAFRFRNHQTDEILGLDLEQFDLDLAHGAASARIESAGRFGESRFFAVGDAAFKRDEKELSVQLEVGVGEARDIKVGAIRAPSVPAWIKANAEFFPLHAAISGRSSFEDRMPHGRLDIAADLSNLREFAYLAPPLALAAETLGAVKASGVISMRGSDFDLEQLEAAISDGRTELNVTGAVSNLLSDTRVDVALTGGTDQVHSVVDTAGLAVDGVAGELINRAGPISLNAGIIAERDRITVDGLYARVPVDALVTEFRGRLQTMPEDLDIELDIQSEADDTAALLQLLGLEEPKFASLGSLKLAARISGNGRQHKIEKARVELQDGNIRSGIKGSLDLLEQAPSFDLDIGLDIDNTIKLAAFAPQLPETLLYDWKLSTTGRINGSPDDFSLSELAFNMTRDDRVVQVDGSVEGLPHDPTSVVDFRYSMREPLRLDQYFPKLGPLEVTGPLDLSAVIRNTKDQVHIEKVALRAEETDIDGDVTIDLSTDPPRIYAVMDSQQLFTKLIGKDPDAEAEAAPEETAERTPAAAESEAATPDQPQDPGELFNAYTHAIAVDTDWIKDLNLYFSFGALKARLAHYELENLLLTLDVNQGVFHLAEYRVELQGRPMSFSGTIDANADPPTYAFSGEMEGDTLEALLNLEEEVFVGGALSGNFDLETRGGTLGELIEHLNGEALLRMGPLEIKSNALSIISSDILSSMLRGITRRSKDQPTRSAYQCAVLGVDVLNGVANVNRSFAMEARDYNLGGRGRVDLNTGYVDLAVSPRARRGLGLSVSSLVGGFNIQGHMATPSFGVGGGGLVTAMIAGYALTPTATAAMASNPATATILVTGFFAKGIFERLTARNFSCENTLQRIERNRARLAGGTTRNPNTPKWRD